MIPEGDETVRGTEEALPPFPFGSLPPSLFCKVEGAVVPGLSGEVGQYSIEKDWLLKLCSLWKALEIMQLWTLGRSGAHVDGWWE